MCPFCYIGKRRFEQAVEETGLGDKIEVEWKSFQLNPDMKTDPSININQYLADIKGWTIDHAREMNAYVTQMAAGVGLTYDFDKAIVANSFNAHRLSHLAKKYGKGPAAEEALFKAYFTDGKNIDDSDTLLQIGLELGLDADEIKHALNSDDYEGEVKQDILEAQQLGVRGVPFFVLDRKYGVSGAQETQVFTQSLQTAYSEWQQANGTTLTDIIGGDVCGPDGNC